MEGRDFAVDVCPVYCICLGLCKLAAQDGMGRCIAVVQYKQEHGIDQSPRLPWPVSITHTLTASFIADGPGVSDQPPDIGKDLSGCE